jgi:hypothetical protein
MTPLLTTVEPGPTGGWRWVLEWVDSDGRPHRLTSTYSYHDINHAHRLACRQADALSTYRVEE